MPQNVEIKVPLADLAAARAAAERLGARLDVADTQVDRYYTLDGGRRVKLRIFGRGGAEVITYDRPEVSGVRTSVYEVTPVRDTAAGVCLVPKGEPLVTVRKRREVHLLDNVRIHLDEVDGLGTFLELEAVVDAAHDERTCARQIDELCRALGVDPASALRASYAELLRGQGPLGGLRVVEQASGLAASYAGFLLAGLGADVVRIEAAAATRARPGDHVLHRNKRSVDVDAAGRRALVAGADAVVADEGAPELPADDGLVRCRVSTWGDAGPYRHLPPDEALVDAATGVQVMQWSWEDRPVWMVTPVVGYMTGILAALGVTAATFARRRGAPGQRVAVNGLGGAFALNTGTYVTGPGHQGALLRGGDPRGAYPNYSFYPTADGWLFVGALTQPFWVKLVTLLDRVELLADPDLPESSLAFVQPHVKARLRAELGPILRTRTTAEWVRRMRAADVPCGAVTTREQFLTDPEAHAAGLVATVDDPVLGRTLQPPAPAAFSDTPAPPPRAASRPGADTDAVVAEAATWRRAPPGSGVAPRACLEGIRVIDLTGFIAGPVCPMLLADLGADVVKIESADGDPFRMTAYGFVGWNRGKRSLVLDLKRREGRDVFLDLAAKADVVVDNLRAGVMNRLGIGWEALHARNPRLVHVSITGYGSSGALVDLPGFDPVFQARSGLAQAQGGTDEPVFHMIAYNDYCAGTLGALATTAALVARERTGRGQRVDVSLFRTGFIAQAADMIVHDGPPAPILGGRDYLGPSAARRVYAAGDGWVCVAATDATAVAALGRVAGIQLRDDDPAEGAAATAIARVLAADTVDGALARLADAGVPAAPCVTFPALLDDPHVRANDAVATIQDPALGPVVLGGPLIQFGATPITYRRSAPGLGHDGPTVLAEAGFPAERIAALVAAGVVGAAS